MLPADGIMNTKLVKHHGSTRPTTPPEERLKRIIAGALSSTIAAHGSISGRLIGSAVKRIERQLVAQYPEILVAINKHDPKQEEWNIHNLPVEGRSRVMQLHLPLFNTKRKARVNS